VTSRDCLIRSLELPVAMRMAARLAVGMATLRRLLLGLVLAGEIDTVGKDVSRFTEGDQVFGFDCFAFGCYADYKCMAETGVLTA
jgi:NADPH:quinone reductase-like Zn-dependent oxidoreductase